MDEITCSIVKIRNGSTVAEVVSVHSSWVIAMEYAESVNALGLPDISATVATTVDRRG